MKQQIISATPASQTDYTPFTHGIAQDPNLSPRTKQKYLREIELAEIAGINLFDPEALCTYASG